MTPSCRRVAVGAVNLPKPPMQSVLTVGRVCGLSQRRNVRVVAIRLKLMLALTSLITQAIARMSCVGGACKRNRLLIWARAALVYDDHSREYLLRFKHADRGDLTPLLARWLYQAGKGIWDQADLIVPVPLHRKRLLKRRYNQSGLLAAKLSQMTGVPWDGLVLGRQRNTRSLGGLGPSSRKREVGWCLWCGCGGVQSNATLPGRGLFWLTMF